MNSMHLRRLVASSSEKYVNPAKLCSFIQANHRTKTYFNHSPVIRFYSAETPHHDEKEISVAIVGAGPSGFYTAKYLQSAIQTHNKQLKTQDSQEKCHSQISLKMDMIEILPTPYGLVRSGVAPDHPEVKNVQNDFQSLFEKSNVCDIEFFGNVSVGSDDVSLSELRDLYDAVILAYGCQSDRKLGSPGEQLDGVFSAREFVNWYNGHPHFTHLGSKISECISADPKTKKVAVIGQGNVALDCARILAKGGSGLYDTDIASHTLPILQDGVKHITVLGRRGHVQGAFTIKELRELTKLQKEGHNTDFLVRMEELDEGMTDATLQELKPPTARPKVRIDKLLRDTAKNIPNGSEKQISLRFLLNPIKFIPKISEPTRLGSILCEKTKLEGEPGNQVAIGTGEYETIDADMALISIGYKGVPLRELEDSAFDEKLGIVKNINGKVKGGNSIPEQGLYVSGWLKRGPSGIIGTNIADAKDTAATFMSDLDQLVKYSKSNDNHESAKALGRKGLLHLLTDRKVQCINWAKFEKINNAEMERSRRRSDLQPREKFTSIQDFLSIAHEMK